MWELLNENPSREKILILLKKNGPLSIDELSKELHITSMGIRQHLLSLERKGLIEYFLKRKGIGRPAYFYKLTERAEELFPKTYEIFTIELLRDLEKKDGKAKIEEIFQWRKERIYHEAKEVMSNHKSFQDKLLALRDFLEAEGYFAEVNLINGSYRLTIFNCPIYKIAMNFTEACDYDLFMYRELFGEQVNREECISEGSICCTYTLPSQ
jgi:predicted ArsR family transcriptional regulator